MFGYLIIILIVVIFIIMTGKKVVEWKRTMKFPEETIYVRVSKKEKQEDIGKQVYVIYYQIRDEEHQIFVPYRAYEAIIPPVRIALTLKNGAYVRHE